MPRYRAPDLRNATMSHLIEEAVKYRQQKSEADFYDKFYSTAIKARMGGRTEYVTENQVALLTVSYTTRISPELCRQILSEEQLAQVSVQSETYTLRFAERPPVTNDADSEQEEQHKVTQES